MEDFSETYLTDVRELIARLRAEEISRIGEALREAFARGGQLLIAGNGGSASTASHLACDLAKNSLAGARRAAGTGCSVTALGQNLALLTAWANDAGYETVFTAEIQLLGQPGDVLLLISVSGDSPNLVRAAEAARACGMTTLAFLGRDGGRLRALVDDCIVVESGDFGIVESIHLVLAHLLAAALADVTAR
jgi:D-sedoheptulose 7-phosphate isomerase